MADYRAGESTSELGIPWCWEAKVFKKKKEEEEEGGDMPKGHRRHVKDASSGQVGDHCNSKINDSNES